MGNKLSWVNNNAQPTNVEIYRSSTKMDTANLTNPLVTLTNGETTWEDTGVIYGATYYYVIQMVTKDGSQKAPTRNIPMQTGLGRGIGPNILQQGDERLGYFGAIDAADFIPVTTLQASQAAAGVTLSAPQKWYKYVRRGKILYIPSGIMAVSFTLVQLYQAGWIHGTDDTGPSDGVLGTPTNQRRIINYRGDKYFIRCPRGYADADSSSQYDLSNTTTQNHDTLTNTPECEFNDLFYPIMKNTPLKQRLYNVDILDAATFVSSSSRNAVCQEISVSKGNALVRMSSSGNIGRDIMTVVTAVPASRSGSNNMFYPVIELVEE